VLVSERSLHVAIDGRELSGRPTGVGRYLASLLHEWSHAPAGLARFTIIAPEAPADGLLPSAGHIAFTQVPGSGGTWWEQTALARYVAHLGPDVFFAPAYTMPLRLACPAVLTIHDLSYFDHPEWFTWREGLRRRILTRLSARRASAVITVSETSARAITTHLGLPRSRLHVVRHGMTPAAHVSSGQEPLVLFVGSLFNRRRIPELIDGFARVAAQVPEARLVLVGDNRTNPRIDPSVLAAKRGIAARVEWRAYRPDRELQALYARARVFAFLSDYEGFALTPLEAVAHGVPPVLLDTEVAREIYGPAALLVPGPPSPERIADALIRLLVDDEFHASLVAAGRERLERYSWARAATDTLEILTQAAVP